MNSVQKAVIHGKKLLGHMDDEDYAIPPVITLHETDVKKYACSVCGSRHSRASDVLHHIYTVHFLPTLEPDNVSAS